MRPVPATVAGAVLTGGASRRMGRTKALVTVGGRPMASRVADALVAAGCRPVWLQGGDRGELAPLGLPVVDDRAPGDGPLVAVVSALDHAGGDLVVAACDLPDLTAEAVTAVLAAGGAGIDVVVATVDGRAQLLARWSVEALPALERLVAAGVRSLHGAVDELRVRRVEVAAAALRNVNHPIDLG